MSFKRAALCSMALLLCLSFNDFSYAIENNKADSEAKYPCYSTLYLGEDKFEKFNRKVFKFNQALNKYAIRPVNVLWASIMPKYGMDRIQYMYTNIEYPKRLVSTFLQRDFKASGHETLRFLTNTTIGLGGMFDPAKKLFNLEPYEEDIAQGLQKCKMKTGPYLVLPVISSTDARKTLGTIIEASLDPALYVASPVTALVKAGIAVNKTTGLQPLISMVESDFADPYDIAKKVYGVERYIKENNFDRKETLEDAFKEHKQFVHKDKELENLVEQGEAQQNKNEMMAIEKQSATEQIEDKRELLVDETSNKELIFEYNNGAKKSSVTTKEQVKLNADIILEGFNPQSPVTDAMRTALFSFPETKQSMWSEVSLWNRSFSKRIKESSVSYLKDRAKCKYRFILQKDKDAPLAILYPSIGEGAKSAHSITLAKMLYDKGYSVLMQGSHFHWEFIKSLPEGYSPGIPSSDIGHLRNITARMVNKLENKYERNFSNKIVIGTSFGAMAALYVGDMEQKENTLDIDKYIAISPPIRLMYSVYKIDKNNDMWVKNEAEIKAKIAKSAAKIMQLASKKGSNSGRFEITMLPFSKAESQLITSFVLRQKLSDIIFTLEDKKSADKKELYAKINNTSFYDYAKEYMLNKSDFDINKLDNITSLYKIEAYLKENDNYKIYHSMDDYLVNIDQLRKLKELCNENLVLLDSGSHLGFLYRKEFQDSLIRDIELNDKLVIEK